MRPRILLRTHYQADEPRAIIAVVTNCSSPTESRQVDAVAAALVKWARDSDYTLSLPGAVYAVGNARSLGLLNDSHRWTATGLAFAYIHSSLPAARSRNGLILAEPEARLYLKCYLEHGGALLVKFGQWLLKRGRTTDEELRAESVIERLLIEALDEYLTIVTDIRDRTVVRKERERLSRSDYASSTKRHKRYPLLKTMERLGLVVATNDLTEERIAISPDADGRLVALLRVVPDVTTLERLCRDEGLPNAIDVALSEHRRQDIELPTAAQLLTNAYRFAIERGLQACPLAYLDDLLFAYPLIEAGESMRGNAEQWFEPLHRRYPTDVRFHVDRRGRRAFVLISGEPSRALEAMLTNALNTSPSSSASSS